jgi:superfamily I DNA and/or RNA helicase
MHPMICRFSNIAYYERKIKSFPSSKKQKIPVLIEPQSDHPDINPSVIFVDFGKYNLHEYRKAKGLGKSFAISKDVEAVISIVILLINKNPDLRMQDIGIIAAGREQKRRIQSVLKTAFSTDDNVTDLQEDSTSETEMETEMETETDTETNLGDLPLPEVDTIEGFQSREKPVIIFVATYIDQNGEIEWVKRRGRVNVGLTRAQRLLIVVGPGKLLEEKLHWNRWISWMRKSYTCPEIRYTSLAKCKAMLDQS